jgi:hypothetical protein
MNINNQNNLNKKDNGTKSTQINLNDVEQNNSHNNAEEIKTNQINLTKANKKKMIKKKTKSN